MPARLIAVSMALALCVLGSAARADELPRATPDLVGISAERLGRIATVLNADIEAGKLPGAVVAIVRKDKLVYFEAFGWRDKAAGVRMTTDTIFSIASMTKPMVAVGALMLTEQGALNVGEPLARYLPQFATMKVAQRDASGQPTLETVPAERAITIQDLFRHTSGLIYGGRGSTVVHKLYPAGSFAAAENLTGAQFLDKLAGLPLLYQPGTVWDYGFGLDVLGLVVEKQARQPLAGYMQDHYGTGTMIVAAAGNLDHDKIVSEAERHFAALSQAKPVQEEHSRYQGGDYREERDLEQVHLVLAFDGVAYEDPDYYAMSILSGLLGGGMSSRLFQEVRERRGLAYGRGLRRRRGWGFIKMTPYQKNEQGDRDGNKCAASVGHFFH